MSALKEGSRNFKNNDVRGFESNVTICLREGYIVLKLIEGWLRLP